MAVPIGVNLSSNPCPTYTLPHPQPLPLTRGGEVLRQQSRGGVIFEFFHIRENSCHSDSSTAMRDLKPV